MKMRTALLPVLLAFSYYTNAATTQLTDILTQSWFVTSWSSLDHTLKTLTGLPDKLPNYCFTDSRWEQAIHKQQVSLNALAIIFTKLPHTQVDPEIKRTLQTKVNTILNSNGLIDAQDAKAFRAFLTSCQSTSIFSTNSEKTEETVTRPEHPQRKLSFASTDGIADNDTDLEAAAAPQVILVEQTDTTPTDIPAHAFFVNMPNSTPNLPSTDLSKSKTPQAEYTAMVNMTQTTAHATSTGMQYAAADVQAVAAMIPPMIPQPSPLKRSGEITHQATSLDQQVLQKIICDVLRPLLASAQESQLSILQHQLENGQKLSALELLAALQRKGKKGQK